MKRITYSSSYESEALAMDKIQANFDELSAVTVNASSGDLGDDDNARVNAALSSLSPTILLPPGHYVLGVDFTIPADGSVHIKGVPGKTVVKYNNDHPAFIFRGEYSGEYPVSSLSKESYGSASGQDDLVTRLSVSGDISAFSVNDICKIYSQDTSSYGATASDKNRIGQLFKVLDVDYVGGFIFTDGLLEEHDKYATSVAIRKIENSSVTLSDITFEINGSNEELWNTELPVRASALQLIGITNLTLDNIKIKSAWAQGINLIGCWNPQANVYVDDLINGTDSNWGGLNALGYGVTVMSCMAGSLSISGTGCRHMFTTVHPKDLSYSPSRWLEYGETIGTTITGVNIGSRGTPFDTHESGIGLSFVNAKAITPLRGSSGNIRSKGFSNRSRHTKYFNCEVIGGNQGFDHSDISHGEVNTVTYNNTSVRNLYGPAGFAYTVSGAGDGNTIARLKGVTADSSRRLLAVAGARCFLQDGMIAVGEDFFCRVSDGGELTIHSSLLDFSNSTSNEQGIRLTGDAEVKVINSHISGDEKCSNLFYADDATGVKEIKYSGVTSDSGTLDPANVGGVSPPTATKIDPI